MGLIQGDISEYFEQIAPKATKNVCNFPGTIIEKFKILAKNTGNNDRLRTRHLTLEVSPKMEYSVKAIS